MAKQIFIGIDNGNKCTKSSSGYISESGIVKSIDEPISKSGVIKFQGSYYTIGPRMSVKWDKTITDETFILSLPPIAEKVDEVYGNIQEPVDVYLGVGLPISNYSKLKSRFRDYFIRDQIDFIYNGKPYSISIKDCRVYPQAYAGYLTCANEYKNCLVNIIDTGGYTTDFLQVENFVINPAKCFSLPYGLITLFSEIEQELLKSNIHLTERQIQDAIMEKKPLLFGTEIQEMITTKAKFFVNDLLDKISEYGFDMKVNANLLLGGGSIVLEKYIMDSGKLNYYDKISAFANAEGYLMLLEQELKKRV